MDEFKAMELVQLPNGVTERGEMGGFTGTIAPTSSILSK
jgi:hypothetical protein